MARRKNQAPNEDAVLEQPEPIAVSEDGALRELAAENDIAVQEDASEQQEAIASGDTDGQSVEAVEAFNTAQRAAGKDEDQVQAPDDPEKGTGSSASREDIEDVLPSEGDYAGVRDPNFFFQERGRERLVEGDTVSVEEAAEDADGGE